MIGRTPDTPPTRSVGYRSDMSSAEILGWFVLLPLVTYAVIALLVYAPSWARGPKYRPGLPWWAQPVWLGGGDLDAASVAAPAPEGGGCSARW